MNQVCLSEDIIREKLRIITRLNLDNFNKEELERLCLLRNNNHICGSDMHTLIRTDSGKIYGLGVNDNGQLGLGYMTDGEKVPILIPELNNIIQISAGGFHSLVLDNNGKVYSFGYNSEGQLGLGNENDELNPKLIELEDYIVDISAGNYHSLLLSSGGDVYSFGMNDSGQLGLKNNGNRNIPTIIPDIKNIIQISAGGFHSLLLNRNGNVYAFGRGEYGQLALGNDDVNIPKLIPHLNNIIKVSAGNYHSLALNNKGQVLSFGYNRYGQLGMGDRWNRNVPVFISELNNIIDISAGNYHNLILNNKGQIYGFGNNDDGRLGSDDVRLERDDDQEPSPVLIMISDNIIEISAGGDHSYLINDKGQIYSFGSNDSWQSGILNVKDTSIPQIIPNLNVLF